MARFPNPYQSYSIVVCAHTGKEEKMYYMAYDCGDGTEILNPNGCDNCRNSRECIECINKFRIVRKIEPVSPLDQLQ